MWYGLKRFFCIVLCFLFLHFPVHGEAEEKYIALTFDDGPSGRFTRALLDGLEERGVLATFFLCGYRICLYPELVARMDEEGHEIGLHGFSHRSMEHMSRQDILAEMEKTAALLPESCSVSLLRPPGGICGDNVCDIASEKGLSVIYWSIDPKDWATDDRAAIEKAVLTKASDGDIILLHDMSDSSVEAALHIIDKLKDNGFHFLTVTQLAKKKGYSLSPGQVYSRFR